MKHIKNTISKKNKHFLNAHLNKAIVLNFKNSCHSCILNKQICLKINSDDTCNSY